MQETTKRRRDADSGIFLFNGTQAKRIQAETNPIGAENNTNPPNSQSNPLQGTLAKRKTGKLARQFPGGVAAAAVASFGVLK